MHSSPTCRQDFTTFSQLQTPRQKKLSTSEILQNFPAILALSGPQSRAQQEIHSREFVLKFAPHRVQLDNPLELSDNVFSKLPTPC
mmetsp:Transcript_9639/g.29251  ORF Transcript_9639/g.29251 Transcript_9639/m.29251 type:complete len:86 (-) Transcript_9639:466-723(-)